MNYEGSILKLAASIDPEFAQTLSDMDRLSGADIQQMEKLAYGPEPRIPADTAARDAEAAKYVENYSGYTSPVADEERQRFEQGNPSLVDKPADTLTPVQTLQNATDIAQGRQNEAIQLSNSYGMHPRVFSQMSDMDRADLRRVQSQPTQESVPTSQVNDIYAQVQAAAPMRERLRQDPNGVVDEMNRDLRAKMEQTPEYQARQMEYNKQDQELEKRHYALLRQKEQAQQWMAQQQQAQQVEPQQVQPAQRPQQQPTQQPVQKPQSYDNLAANSMFNPGRYMNPLNIVKDVSTYLGTRAGGQPEQQAQQPSQNFGGIRSQVDSIMSDFRNGVQGRSTSAPTNNNAPSFGQTNYRSQLGTAPRSSWIGGAAGQFARRMAQSSPAGGMFNVGSSMNKAINNKPKPPSGQHLGFTPSS